MFTEHYGETIARVVVEVNQRGFATTWGGRTGIGTLPIVYFGTEEQKKKYLPRLAAGEIVGAYALSEASSGSDALNCRARAELSKDGKHYVLNGEKMWITNAGFADLFTVFAKVDGEKSTAFLVEKSFPGFSIGAEEHKMGIRGSSTCPIILNDCKVRAENVLGEIGKGHVIAFNILNVGHFKLGTDAIMWNMNAGFRLRVHHFSDGEKGIDAQRWRDNVELERLRVHRFSYVFILA